MARKSKVVGKVIGKKLLVNKLVKDTGIDLPLASFVYDTLFDAMRKQIEKGQGVLLPGIGRIVLVHTRSFKSNMTDVFIPEHKRVTFMANSRFARKIRVESRDYIKK